MNDEPTYVGSTHFKYAFSSFEKNTYIQFGLNSHYVVLVDNIFRTMLTKIGVLFVVGEFVQLSWPEVTMIAASHQRMHRIAKLNILTVDSYFLNFSSTISVA